MPLRILTLRGDRGTNSQLLQGSGRNCRHGQDRNARPDAPVPMLLLDTVNDVIGAR